MSKRARVDDGFDQDGHRPDAKRARQHNIAAAEVAPNIQSARDLQLLLAFQQDAKTLKSWDQTSSNSNLEHLAGYLNWSKSTNAEDEQPTYVQDLIQTWTFASEKNDDGLVSASVAVLALLLKTISTDIELRDVGLGICRTILQHNTAKLLLKGVSAPKHKEHVISPCLRLLTEIVLFDGGIMGRQLYSKRTQVFEPRIIARCLAIVGRGKAENVDVDQRPSVRSNTLRYVLANLKFQVEAVKLDIIKQSNVVSAMLSGIVHDPVPLIAEVLTTVDKYILRDRSIPWTSKIHFTSDRSLKAFATLYHIETPEAIVPDQNKSILKIVHDFMLRICTSTTGSLRPTNGFYPTKTGADDSFDDGVLEGGDSDEEILAEPQLIARNLSIRNQALAAFAQTLRPYANTLERDLLLEIFVAAPELVADYWLKKESFNYEPKLTATWIGYSAFIFSTIQLPLPAFLGSATGYALSPPSAVIVVESILPLPLSTSTLRKCLVAHSPLMNLFVTRTLIAATRKLKTVLGMYQSADAEHSNKAWLQASQRLTAVFMRRCPSMKDIIESFRRTSETDLLLMEAITELLSLYYEVLPQLASSEKLDISTALTLALEQAISRSTSEPEDKLHLLRLQHLVTIATHSTEISWWKRPDKLKFSAFLTIVHVQARSTDLSVTGFEDLLQSIIDDKGLLQNVTERPAIGALVRSLRSAESSGTPTGLLNFIDDCLSRYIARQIVYEDQLDAFLASHGMQQVTKMSISPWTMTLLEQWPFVAKNRADDLELIAKWLFQFLQELVLCGEHEQFLGLIMEQMYHASPNGVARDMLLRSKLRSARTASDDLAVKSTTAIDKVTDDDHVAIDGALLQACRPNVQDAVTNFNKFRTADLEVLLNASMFSDLLLTISSEEKPARIQAMSALQHFMIRLQGSANPDRDMIYILLGELVESAQIHERNTSTPLPFLATMFAVEALKVIRDPAHIMYVKIAGLLTTRPYWNPFKLVREMLTLVILAESTEETDMAAWKECIWLLTWLFNGLRTPEDCEILRQVGAWETLGSLVAHPFFARTTVGNVDLLLNTTTGRPQKVISGLLVKLVGRAIVLGAGTTLATRTAHLLCIDIWRRLMRVDGTIAHAFKQAMLEQDSQKLQKWSHGALLA